MRIGLMGCEFSSANKGCEALSYSILSILNEIDNIDDNSIIYNFSGTDLGNIPTNFKRFSFINVMPSLKDIKFRYLRALKKCDLILDVTMGDSFSDIYSSKYYKWIIRNKKIAQILCKKYILLPQTYGPFSNKNSLDSAKKIIKKASKVYCRDKLSQDLLLNECNLENSILTTDLAFFLPYDKTKYKFRSDNIKIGVNISGLLYKGGFESDNQFNLSLDYKKYINDLLSLLNNDKNYEVYIIPHVIDKAKNAHDDDYKISEKIKKKFKNIKIAPAFDNPIDAKSFISNMDIFIGSRMHSTIAAFSSNVVTIPISYSRKFEGLYNDLNYKYVINGREETTESTLEKTIEYINNSNKLKTAQNKAIKIINNKKKKFLEDICKYFEEK